MFKNLKNQHLIISIFVLIGVLLVFGIVFAQDLGFGSVNTIAKTSGYQTSAQGMAFLNTTLADFINILLGLIGVVFVGLAVYSGYQWMTAGGEEEKVRTAQGRLKSSIIGLIIVLLAFVGTRTVFTFFYQQGGDRSTDGVVTISCTDYDTGPNNECAVKLGRGYACFNGTCKLASEFDACANLQSQPVCDATNECVWNQTGTCENINQISTCSVIKGVVGCAKKDNCVWMDSKCWNDGNISCDGLLISDCILVKHCFWMASDKQCTEL